MSTELQSVVEVFEKLWPTALAEDWDVVGLVVGSRFQDVKTVLLTVDVTQEVVQHSKEIGADLILAHHPLLLRGVTALAEDSAKGSVLSELIRSNTALYSAHTNADASKEGTSATLASLMSLRNVRPLNPIGDTDLGIGQIGSLPASMILGDLAALLNDFLPPTATGVRVAGAFNRTVQTIAVCAGAGDSYLELALDAGADVYITSDLRHHRAQEILELAKARGVEFSLIDISHWAAEFVWLETARKILQVELPQIKFEVCDIRTDVFEFLMNKTEETK